MDTEDPNHRRIPTLVQICQRAAVAHVDSIYSFGEELSYPLIKPILERCSLEQLIRFEQLSPHLEKDTSELWKDLCFRKYRLTAIERYSIDNDPQEPDSWKSRYFVLQDAEAKRLEELGSRIRTQRLQADERKKEKEVKYTDRIPNAKRPRFGAPVQPKTLFQRTKSEASKVQRTFNARVLPPMPAAKSYRALPHSPSATSPLSSASSSSRVTVNTVVIHRRLSAVPSTHAASSSALPRNRIPLPAESRNTGSRGNRPAASQSSPTRPAEPVPDPPHVAQKSPSVMKKDSMASLFVPKRKACTQRPM